MGLQIQTPFIQSTHTSYHDDLVMNLISLLYPTRVFSNNQDLWIVAEFIGSRQSAQTVELYAITRFACKE